MKKDLILVAAELIVFSGCRNQDQNLAADVEIPVSVEEIKPKAIEEFVNTTGTAGQTDKLYHPRGYNSRLCYTIITCDKC